MLTVLIIENEPKSQQLLSSILEEYCPSIHLLGIAANFKQATNLIETAKPELVFMDIELDGTNAFEILESITNKHFQLIFTTAYAEHALKAFRHEAIDYILKPYSPTQVIQAVNRVKNRLNNEVSIENIEAILQKQLGPIAEPKFSVSTSDGIHIIKLKNLIRVEANGAYATIYQVGQKSIIVSKTMKDIEKYLMGDQFYRVHDSHIINTNFIKLYSKEDGGSIVMENGDVIPISRRRKQEFSDKVMGL